MTLKDKVVVITGSSRGLGRALAYGLAKEGARVVVSAPNTPQNKAELAKIAKDINALALTADVRNENELLDLAKKAIEHFGRIDMWINNAGVWLPRASVEELDMNRVHDLFEINVFGTIYGSRAALKHMKDKNSGTIVNIISSSALTGRPFVSAYASSKHAVKGFNDSLREELMDQGSQIKVIGIYPGGIKTNLFDEKKPDDFNDYMDVETIASAIIENFKSPAPLEELILKRPGQNINIKSPTR